MDLHFSYLLESLRDPGTLDDTQMEQFVNCCAVIDDLPTDELNELFDAMQQHCSAHTSTGDAPPEPLLTPVLARTVVRQHRLSEPIEEGLRQRVVSLYGSLGTGSRCAWRLLQYLATAATQADLAALTECIIAAPPDDPQAAALALTPLFQSRDYDPTPLFPHLFASLQHLSIAAPVLDLSNYLVRSGMLHQHPAATRSGDLAQLLGSLVQQLGRIEENPGATSKSPEQLGTKVDECVSLVVALCDAMALIGSRSVVGKLYDAMELGHRRIQTEAAAALAKLGESAGVDQLVQLAAEPVARLRVIAHAEELNIVDKIDEALRTDEARAEAQIALELSQPTFFGVPPSKLERIDSRTQFWPGYDAPVLCFLFRYEYQFQDALYSNIAIAGPLVHALAADLSDFPPGDIYAAYAGWDLDDENVFEIPLDAPTMAQRAEAERLERRLHDAQYDAIQSLVLGFFFGERVLVARARREERTGIVVVDQSAIDWFPLRTLRNPIDAHTAFCIYQGRRLLRSFNG